MKRTLGSEFFNRPTLIVARELLGKMLVRKTPHGLISGMIVEVESYVGPADKASHAYDGKRTPRTEPMFGKPGTVYVYQIYGQNHCMNVVTEQKDHPSAVLIRAVEPFAGMEHMHAERNLKKPDIKNLCSGPGKLCQALKINKEQNNISIEEGQVFIEDFITIPDEEIIVTPRIGIDYAQEAVSYPFRFFIKGSNFISEKNKHPHTKSFAELIAEYTNKFATEKLD